MKQTNKTKPKTNQKNLIVTEIWKGLFVLFYPYKTFLHLRQGERLSPSVHIQQGEHASFERDCHPVTVSKI